MKKLVKLLSIFSFLLFVMFNSLFALDRSTVQKAYVACLGRPADPVGLAYFTTYTDLVSVVNYLLGSPEASNYYNQVEATILWVWFHSFGSLPTYGTMQNWASTARSSSLAGAVQQIITTAGSQTILSNKAQSSINFTQVIDPELDGNPPYMATYSGLIDANAGRNWLKQSTSVLSTSNATTWIKIYIADPGDPILNQ